MSCCGSCAHGRECEGKKKRKNPNFLYLANGRRGRRRRRNPEASNTWIYQANGRRRRNPYSVTVSGRLGSRRIIERTRKAAGAAARAMMSASPHGHWPGYWPYVKAVGGEGHGVGITVIERRVRRKKRRS